MSAPARRYRSIPHRRHFFAAALWWSLHTLSLLAMLVILIITIILRNQQSISYLLLAMGIMAVTWFITFLFRRAAKCPLCRGTPLWDNGNAKHQKAHRIRPFNYGYSAMLKLVSTQHFRCMDCGTAYDLTKKSRHGKM